MIGRFTKNLKPSTKFIVEFLFGMTVTFLIIGAWLWFYGGTFAELPPIFKLVLLGGLYLISLIYFLTHLSQEKTRFNPRIW